MKHNTKVWIITRRAGYNFGSSLQAYAMQRIIDTFGFKSQIIDYDEYNCFFSWKIRPFVENIQYRIFQLAPAISRLIFSERYSYLITRSVQIKNFESFEHKYLNLTIKRYHSSKAIENDASSCDICISGSDQIWSPLFFDPAFFLDFCKNKETKKVAYAPSFGVNTIEQKSEGIRNKIKELLLKFDHLSVREDEGAKIINDLVGKEVPVVLDPTLLLEKQEWQKLVNQNIDNEPYILCYFLGTDNLPLQFIDSLKKETGYKVINICTFRTMNTIPGDILNTLSPSEFISYIANASIVCTDSFHGSIFSIIFNRQFFTFERFKKHEKNSQNSRIYNLLSEKYLKDRLFSIDNTYQKDTELIDYKRVDEHFRSAKDKSLNYLKSALTE